MKSIRVGGTVTLIPACRGPYCYQKTQTAKILSIKGTMVTLDGSLSGFKTWQRGELEAVDPNVGVKKRRKKKAA